MLFIPGFAFTNSMRPGAARASTKTAGQGPGRAGLLAALLMMVALAGCGKGQPFYIGNAAGTQTQYQNPVKTAGATSPAAATGTGFAVKASSPAISLQTYTPGAAFFGNQLGIVGGATGTASNPAGAILVRESNCSLTQYGISYGSTGLYGSSSSVVATLPNADAYLHQLSGLGTTPGVFPKGCSNRTLGTASAPYAHLGRASDGNFMAVYVDDQGKIVLLKISVSGAVISQTTLVSAGAASSLAVADFNGDGIADIVTPYLTVGNATGIGLFLSQANGSFGAATLLANHPASVDRFFSRASIEDINGDGKPDIVAISAVFSNATLPTVVSLLGNGAGGFVLASSALKALSAMPFVIADFNGDGKADLMTASGEWTPGLGNGSFGAPVQSFADSSLTDGRNLAVGDFNGDGLLDIVVRSGQLSLSVFLGRGDGSFTARATYAAINGAEAVNVTDLNGDGFADIVVGLSAAGIFGSSGDAQTVIQFLMGKGDGRFVAAQSFTGFGKSVLYSGVSSFALADFNGDNYPDIVAADPAGGKSLPMLAGSSAGSFSAAGNAATLSFRPAMIISGDTDGDGKADILAVGSSIAVLRALGAGTFAATQTFALPAVDGSLKSIAAGDVNGDGRTDLLVIMGGQSATTGGAYLYLANADGSLKAPAKIDPALNLRSVAIGDLNGDGRADIALGSEDTAFYTSPNVLNGIRVYLGNADGSVSASATVHPSYQYPALVIGDLDKDGKADLIAAGQSSGLNDSIHVLPGQGNGSFGPTVTLALAGGGPGVKSIALGDFTFDGKPDIMLAGGYVEVLEGKGDGSLIEASALTIAGRSTYIAASDLNRDGMPDALVVGPDGLIPLLRVASAVSPGSTPVSVPANEFAVGLSSPSATVISGQSAQTSLSLSFGAAFTQAVSFTCSGLPAYASCNFSPASLTPGSGVLTTTLTLRTGVPVAALGGAALALVSGLLGMGFSAPPGTPGAGAPGSGTVTGTRRRQSIRRPALALLMLAALSLGLVTACGGGSGSATSSAAVTPTGTYAVTVTASGGGVTKSQSFSLTVQ